jgi:hypothetical protein
MSIVFSLLFIFNLTICSVYAGGYFITDKDGRVISEDSEKIIMLGPTEKTIVLNDYNGSKIFDIYWDASEKSIIIKGINIHLKVYSNGRMERWTEIKEGWEEQYPILIEPIVPILPENKPNQK